MKNILVVGGAGFIGSHFVDLAIQKNLNVTVLDALTYAGKIEHLPTQHIYFVKGSILDETLISQVLVNNKIDTVVNFAAESHVDRSIKQANIFVNTNIVGTATLLQACLNYYLTLNHPFKYLQISTDEVYGTLGKTGCFTELSPVQPRSPYSASKAAADHLVMAWFHTYGFPAIITRCSNNYGPRQDREKLIPKMIYNALHGLKLPIYGQGENVRDWIYVKDHCIGIFQALEHGICGKTYCFGGDEEWENLTLINHICQQLDFIHPRKNKLSYQKLITFITDRKGHDFRYAINNDCVIKELQFKINYPFAQGLSETIAWYCEQYLKTEALA